ncbi:glucose-1-phosphate thymidylyltransferase [Salsuginibacillus kocurii]|uniref:glucose-1-phosphate thymidylyltransferase n=1 Tax=Salsuginibacillus kocurii TaxID=427078 RepID=UPI000372038C|nr:glucose-1-phosphate thymidylyltransferase [Salsuginibacillus kocurii]
MKGLILAAGKGTRLRPLSYTKPKPLLPVANQSVINYGIEQLYNLGIREVGVVIHPSQEDIFKRYLQINYKKGIHVHYIFQHEQKGISHAIGEAQSFIGSEPFVVLLGDNLIDESLTLLKDQFNKNGVHGAVMLSEVNRPQDYGIAEIKNERIINVQEKPQAPKSNLAVIGVYMFDPAIFTAIQSISPSARGEYEITDVIQWMIDNGCTVNYVKTDKPTFDVGTMERWLDANRWKLKQKGDQWDNDFNGKYQDSIIIPPVKIGTNCHIENSIIGPYTSVESDVTIKNSFVQNSIILKNARVISVPYEIKDSIVGENTEIISKEMNANTMQGIIGDQSSIIFSNSAAKRKKK